MSSPCIQTKAHRVAKALITYAFVGWSFFAWVLIWRRVSVGGTSYGGTNLWRGKSTRHFWVHGSKLVWQEKKPTMEGERNEARKVDRAILQTILEWDCRGWQGANAGFSRDQLSFSDQYSKAIWSYSFD